MVDAYFRITIPVLTGPIFFLFLRRGGVPVTKFPNEKKPQIKKKLSNFLDTVTKPFGFLTLHDMKKKTDSALRTSDTV